MDPVSFSISRILRAIFPLLIGVPQKLLLKNRSGIGCGDDDLEDLEGLLCILVEKGLKDILQILLDHGADAKQKSCMGKILMSGLGTNVNGE